MKREDLLRQDSDVHGCFFGSYMLPFGPLGSCQVTVAPLLSLFPHQCQICPKVTLFTFFKI
eukprot:1972661-Amphidinium_carterae.1